MSEAYLRLVDAKRVVDPFAGFEPGPVHPRLLPHQRDLAEWSIRRGRAALFAATGLGKTAIQLEWAWQVTMQTGKPVLILAPLAVGPQTAAEGQLMDLEVLVAADGSDLTPGPGIYVTNYERLHRFDPAGLGGLVLDESSILKAFTGRVRQQIQAFAAQVEHRLACTATPAPNDVLELCNHSEYVGAMSSTAILTTYMTVDADAARRGYRVKRPAERAWAEFVASWAWAIRRPSDLGYADEGYALPELLELDHEVAGAERVQEGRLFAVDSAFGLRERQAARRESVQARAARVAELVASEPDEPWLVWCDLNDESTALAKLIPGAVEVRGSDKPEAKAERLEAFRDGRAQVLVTKPSIAGWGLNFQRCARVAFCGLSDSFEAYHQAVRRSWRFGQTRPVHVHRVTSVAERAVRDNIDRKKREHDLMMDAFIDARGRLRTGRDADREVAYAPAEPIELPTWLRTVKAAA